MPPVSLTTMPRAPPPDRPAPVTPRARGAGDLQAREERGGKARALADAHHDVEGLQPARERLLIDERVGERLHGGMAVEPSPVRQGADETE